MEFEIIVPVRPGDRDRFPVRLDGPGTRVRSREIECADGRLALLWRTAFASSDADVVVFKHDDVEIVDWPDFSSRVVRAMRTFPVVGVAGAAVYSPSFGRWWRGIEFRAPSLRGRVGHLRAGGPPAREMPGGARSEAAGAGARHVCQVIFGPPGPAVVLDGCLVAVCRNEARLRELGWSVAEILACWDTDFGRHFYDVSFTYNVALLAATSGRPPACCVVDARIVHHQPVSVADWEDPEFVACEARFIGKYGRRPGLDADFQARNSGLAPARRVIADGAGDGTGGRRAAPTEGHAALSEERVVRRAQELRREGRVAEAVHVLKRGVAAFPASRTLRVALAYALMETGHITEALAVARPLLADAQTEAEGWNLIGFGLVEQARVREGLEAFQKAAALHPQNNRLLSNILFSSLYADHLSPEAITRLHRRLGERIERNARGHRSSQDAAIDGSAVAVSPPDAAGQTRDGGGPSPRKRRRAHRELRIGFLSADLRRHPVGYFLRQFLQHRDARRCAVVCYHTVAGGDDLTRVLREASDLWRDCGTAGDEEIARRIRADGLDVLIDLGGHTAANRAGVLARRPAPAQAVYLGYPATTGLPSVDAIIGDSWVSPPEHAALFTERIYRLPGCFLCYHPPETAPPVAPLPCDRAGAVTFGSFNHLSKLSDTTVRLWARILRRLPESRLVLKALALTDPGTRQWTARRFAGAGIDPERIVLLPPTVPLERFLQEYGRVDIALDPTPYGGGTTTCEALWMGVPVVTLPGTRFAGRMSASILSATGLNELIAESADAYVEMACSLAEDRERLREYRETLRQRVAASPLTDGPAFAAAFLEIVRKIADDVR